MRQPLPPFSCTYSPNIPELLWELGCTLIISTYQAGKVICLSAPTSDKLIQLPRSFPHAMGIGVRQHQLAIATAEEVVILGKEDTLAWEYPQKPKTYDTLYVPRATYYTGRVDLHDVEWGGNKLWGVNTIFSCLCHIDDAYSFRPVWKPSFISALAPEDRCHLNGLAMIDGQAAYVTALGSTNHAEGWRQNKLHGGVLISVDSNEILLDGLAMPHSPRVIDQHLYFLQSASGELISYNLKTREKKTVKQFDGFVRGMDRYGDYLFIGLSKLRTSSSSFRDLPIAQHSNHCGIVVLHLPTASIVGQIQYQNSVEELYDVKVLPEVRRPGILSPSQDIHKKALVLPDTSFWAKSIS
ncbi:MAG: TIGR03032 family protein [Bacteroidota bacterium]